VALHGDGSIVTERSLAAATMLVLAVAVAVGGRAGRRRPVIVLLMRLSNAGQRLPFMVGGTHRTSYIVLLTHNNNL
jgi:hypothetical protein